LLAAAGCAGPAQRIDRMAAGHGFVREIVQGERYAHVIYRNVAAAPARALHVYIEGDGKPYVDRDTIARDPTPDNPVMLRLMALDDAPSLYLGRPCYFGLHAAAECSAIDWTIGRFSEDVVGSMAAVAESVRGEVSARRLVLIGHSGGAAIAALLARRLSHVDALITIGGNLDTGAWTELHDYAPLTLSLNPSDQPLRSVPTVLHLVGAEDDVTPPDFVVEAARRLDRGRVRVVERAGHACCWEQLWPSVLDGLR
jgi:pimeloyl-ACP methyl ester carboxylesterase